MIFLFHLTSFTEFFQIGLEKSSSRKMKSLILPQLEKFHSLQKLGGGTYGKIYEAVSQDNQVFAVKRILIPKIYSGTIVSTRELNILLEAKNHPFCIQIKDIHYSPPFGDGSLTPDTEETATDKVYFLLEKGDMDGLRYNRNKSISWVDRKLFLLHLALSLEFLHSRGIYHRDVKPANVICFLNPDGTLQAAKLTDFGLSQYYTTQTLSLPDMVTLWYRAPEIALRKEYNLKVDVWSFGCILYEYVAGTQLLRPESDLQLINSVIGLLPFPREDILLARQIMGNVASPGKIMCLRDRIHLPDYQIASFNSSLLGGKSNSGNYRDYLDLLEGCLKVNPKERLSMNQVLNHPFFNGHRKTIHQTRSKFGINSEGEFVFQTVPTLDYKPGNIRSFGMNLFRSIYFDRLNFPVRSWYSDRILFHGIEMFDRFLLSETEGSSPSLWVNTFLFISAKFFRIMQPNVGIDLFAYQVPSSELALFRNQVIQFEEFVIRDVFKGRIYQPTLYEESSEYLTEDKIKRLLEIVFNQEVPSRTPFSTILQCQGNFLGPSIIL